MKRSKRPYNFATPGWLRAVQTTMYDFIIPLTVFQALRTLLFPTLLDFILLIVFIGLTIKTHFEP